MVKAKHGAEVCAGIVISLDPISLIALLSVFLEIICSLHSVVHRKDCPIRLKALYKAYAGTTPAG